MKQFRNSDDGSSLHFLQSDGKWLVKFTRKGEWLRHAKTLGAFDSEGDALLSVCMSQDLNFSKYKQIYPKEKLTAEAGGE